ncbi:T9SS type A sorting domain-containing protein [bacterium]|nr:T9SS type A sorting domain-containing protein [bacterium]
MRSLSKVLAVIALLAMLGVANSFALNVTIIESQSYNPSHTMDLEWQAVATAMGHAATIVPQSTLDTGAFIPGTDVLIVSSGVIPLPPPRIDYIFECLYAGKAVYVQSEDSPNQPGNIAWQQVLNMFGEPFSWITPVPGNMRATVHGPIGAEYNAVPMLVELYDGCVGTTSNYVRGTLRFNGDDFGFLYNPANAPFAGMAATTSDQEWIRLGLNPALMENIIDSIIDDMPLDRYIRINPNPPGPVTVPLAGGSFDYDVQISYTDWVPVTFRAWTRLILPSGAVWGTLVGPATISWAAPTTTPVFTFTQYIPGFAPAGLYFVQGVLGDVYPGFATCFDSDNFMFQKLTVSADGSASAEPVTAWKSEGSFSVAADNETGLEQSSALPDEFSVGQAYPNPFNPSTTIDVSLADASNLTVTVYDVQGREVATLAKGAHTAGLHSFSFDASGLASGVYFLRANVPGQLNETRKLVLMR